MKRRAYEAGLNPNEYWDAAFEDVLEMIQANSENLLYQRRVARTLNYLIFCAHTDSKNRISITDFEPLPGDENPEDRRQAIIERFKAKGLI